MGVKSCQKKERNKKKKKSVFASNLKVAQWF